MSRSDTSIRSLSLMRLIRCRRNSLPDHIRVLRDYIPDGLTEIDDSICNVHELPALIANPDVTSITMISPVTGVEVVIWQAG